MTTEIITRPEDRGAPSASSAGDVLTVPVLVVGAGPTGLTASILLSKFGVPSLTVERHPGTSIYPRAIAINTRSMEIFRGFGLEQRVRNAGFAGEPRVARSSTLVDADPAVSPSLGTPPGVSPTRWTNCSQLALEPILLEEAASHPIAQLRFNTELVSFEETAEGIRAALVDRDSGQRTEVRSRYLIAADGARSRVRGHLGIAMQGPGELGQNVAIHFRAPLAQRLLHRPIFLHRVENDRAHGVFFTTDGGTRWVFTVPYSPDKGETAEDIERRPVELVRAGSGVPDLDVDVITTVRWTTQADVARTYRHGDVFLAGDAAHRQTPAGGLGLNTGVQDAHNLAWKLAAVLQGWARAELLDTYEPERHPVAQANVERSVALLIDRPAGPPESAPTVRTAIDFDLGFRYTSTAVVADGSMPVTDETGDFRPEARPGCRLPHCWLDASEQISTHDLIGPHFTLLTGDVDGPWRTSVSDLRPMLASTGIPLRTYMLPPQARSDWTARFGIASTGAVLVRPDGHVAWRQRVAAQSPVAELTAVLDRVLGRAGSTTDMTVAAAAA